MRNDLRLQPVDYLVIGHITQDLTPNGPVMGGTAAYSALTAQALGLRVGIVTAHDPNVNMLTLQNIPVAAAISETTTTFENKQTAHGRVQHVFHPAPVLTLADVPEVWRTAPIIHLGPVLQEVDPKLTHAFENAFIALTPQGWLRTYNQDGLVHYTDWPEARYVLEGANAAVISVEDVQGSEEIIDEMAASIRVLAVTEGSNGARLYWNGDVRTFRAPAAEEVDPTGAGDIFATGFFYRLHTTRDPWEAARFATQLAANSVTRPGLSGIPTREEINDCKIEILP